MRRIPCGALVESGESRYVVAPGTAGNVPMPITECSNAAKAPSGASDESLSSRPGAVSGQVSGIMASAPREVEHSQFLPVLISPLVARRTSDHHVLAETPDQ